MSTGEKLTYPRRRRCLGCGRGLGVSPTGPVLDGLYCSPACAKVPTPADRAADAPRECKTQRENRWVFKRKYRCEEEIPDKLREDPSTNFYRCSHCRHLHIGHSRVAAPETLRALSAPQDLADFLVKSRGRATRKQVAAAARIRPIRLKELEEPAKDQRVDLQALFEVLDVLGVRLATSSRRTGH